MSNNKLIAVAIAAALAAPFAYAVTITPAGETVNSNQFDDAASTVAISSKTVAAQASDSYLGRTVGYNVRVTLSAGKIQTSPTITATGGAASASLITGTGAPGSTDFVVRVVPNAGGTQVGEGFTITNLAVDNLQSFGPSGGTLNLSGVVSDPTTGATLPNSTFAVAALIAKEGVAVNFDPTGSPFVIDVGQPSAKKFFVSSTGAIGTGNSTNVFNAGKISITDNTGVTPWLPPTGTADITIGGADFSAFRPTAGDALAGVFLSDLVDCSTRIGAVGTIAANGQSATFTRTLGDLDPAEVPPATAPYDAFVCFDANGTTAIAKQQITAAVVVKPGAGFLNATAPATNLAEMKFNGPVTNVLHFNPASNTAQQSYIRISNTSNVNGRVTIEGVCDSGVKSSTPSSMTLEAGKSLLLTADEVENGSTAKGFSPGLGTCANVNGTPANKYRLTVTGEFSTMEVQNFLRNINSAGTVNTNVNNQN